MYLAEGSSLGPFRILALIGQGGMGEVYRARDPRLGRDVAIKVLPHDLVDDPDRLRRFELESRAVAQLSHPNVVHLHDVGNHDGTPYLVMEFLDGKSLRETLKDGPLPSRKVIDLGRQVALGLAAAHDAGIIHRDLKPENVFLTKGGAVKILDFGLAKGMAPLGSDAEALTSPTGLPAPAQLTQEGVMMGTVGYLAPEQIKAGEVDPRTDIFALGVVLWEALTGHSPFLGETVVDTLHSILRNEIPEPPPELRVPQGLEKILRHCLDKEPAARFQSAHDVALALESSGGSFSSTGFRNGMQVADPPAPSRTVPSWGWPAGVLALLMVALGAWFLHPDPRQALRFTRITPRQGLVTGAAFLPGNEGIVYSFSIDDDQPEELFRVDHAGELPRSLGIKGGALLSVNDKGEFLLLMRNKPDAPSGVLAALYPSAKAPRELAHGVAWADWGPDGTPIIKYHRYQGKRTQVFEYPKGRILYEVPFGYVVASFVVSPNRQRIAFLEQRSTSVYLVVIQLSAGTLKRKLLGTGLGFSAERLGWDEKGILFSKWDAATQSARLVRINDQLEPGKDLLGLPWPYEILAGQHGAWLLSESRNPVVLNWLRPATGHAMRSEWSENLFHGASLSDDGTRIAGMDDRGIFVLEAANPSPILVGEGFFTAYSPDGKWILSKLDKGGAGTVFRLSPVGEGESANLPGEWISNQAAFLKGSRRILLSGKRTDTSESGSFIVDLATGKVRLLTEELVMGPISPDDRWALQFNPKELAFHLYNLETATADPRPVSHYGKETIAGWTQDGKGLWIVLQEQPDASKIQVSRLDLASRVLRPSHVLSLPAANRPQSLQLSLDGKSGLQMDARNSGGFLLLAEGIQ